MSEIEEISVLIIEDEAVHIQVLQDAFDDFNEETPHLKILSRAVTSYKESLELLLVENFDAVIVDLNLKQSTTKPEELEGNKIVDIIRDKLRLPIIIRTGYPTQFHSDLIDETNDFLTIYTKDDSTDNIIKDIIRWQKNGVSHTLGAKGVFEYYLNELFWVQISKNLTEWEQNEIDSASQERSLIRYTLNVLQEYLEIDTESGGYEHFHPAEVYIKPPVKESLFFGDILKDEGERHFIILTPACEMAQGKCKKVLLARINEYDNVEKFMSSKERYLGNTESSKKKQVLEQWFRNGHSDGLGYHFLPSYSDFPGGLIDFQDVQTIDYDKIELIKIATVTSQFAKDISSRFTSYYARQGQPSLNSELIIRNFT